MGNIKFVWRYLKYLLTAKTQYDIHSPFVFDFVKDILKDARHFYAFDEIEFLRDDLLADDTIITIEDLGAGSKQMRSDQRRISDIAASSLTNEKFGRLLFRIAQKYLPEKMLELGTSLGISALYMAKGNEHGEVVTIEGSGAIAEVAKRVIDDAGQTNIRILTGDFQSVIDTTLVKEKDFFDLIYIDGNHREVPTLAYFETLVSFHAHHDTIFIFDDIHWSDGMESAWQKIKAHPRVTLTIDLFYKGIVVIHPEMHQKQHFVLKY